MFVGIEVLTVTEYNDNVRAELAANTWSRDGVTIIQRAAPSVRASRSTPVAEVEFVQ
jgi:hypothetical protein